MTNPKARTLLIACLMMPLLASCSNPGEDSCHRFKPVYVDRAKDVISPGTARQILANNLSGELGCGWKRLRSPD